MPSPRPRSRPNGSALQLASLAALLLGMLAAVAGPALAALPDLSGRASKSVVVVPIDGTIDLGLAPFVQRAIDENPDAAAIVLDVDTFGGRVDAAVQIRDALLETDIPTVAFVNRRAISAGALISLATDTIVFTPGATMGAATPITLQGGEAAPVEEKMVSYMRSEMRATAEATGRSGDIAEAMVDASVELEGLSDEGKLLTLTTENAVTAGIADGVSSSLGEALDSLGLATAERIQVESTWAEDIARILTQPELAGLLMSLGFLGIMIELYSPGFGLPGAVGVTSLVLFFFGHMTVHLAGWEELILLSAGLLALALEAFVIPGFGVAGITGIVLVFAALTLALVGAPLELAWDLGLLTDALGRVIIFLGAAAAAMIGLMFVLPRRKLPGWLVLDAKLDDHAPGTMRASESASLDHGPRAALLHREGVAETDLRLSGKARIDGELIDVVSQHEYIDRGTAVRVVELEGMRVVVARVG